jgi:uncharacterized membrane protein
MPDEHRKLADVVHRNIDSVHQVWRDFERRKSRRDRLADAITSFAGSITFVAIHAVLVALWIIINVGLIPGITPFDPFPFTMLTMIASVEVLFISTFVLISENRSAVLAERRAELDLQINLLAEHETTRLIELVDAIARHLGVTDGTRPDVEQLKREVAPEAVLQEIEAARERAADNRGDAQASKS